jgi:hypothetical protein
MMVFTTSDSMRATRVTVSLPQPARCCSSAPKLHLLPKSSTESSEQLTYLRGKKKRVRGDAKKKDSKQSGGWKRGQTPKWIKKKEKQTLELFLILSFFLFHFSFPLLGTLFVDAVVGEMHERVFDIAAAGVKFGCGEAGETLLVQIDAQRIIATQSGNQTHAIQTKTMKKKEINALAEEGKKACLVMRAVTAGSSREDSMFSTDSTTPILLLFINPTRSA